MRRLGSFALAALALFSAMLPAAGERSPIVLSAEFMPPFELDWQVQRGHAASEPTCHIRVGEVHDTRADSQSMGEVGGRPVRASDAAGWVKSALLSLNRDSRLGFDTASDAIDLVLSADIVKAYVINITSDKSTTIVVRVHFTRRDGTNAEQVFRGVDTGLNWVSGENETQGQFNRALGRVIEQVDQNLTQRCAGMLP